MLDAKTKLQDLTFTAAAAAHTTLESNFVHTITYLFNVYVSIELKKIHEKYFSHVRS